MNTFHASDNTPAGSVYVTQHGTVHLSAPIYSNSWPTYQIRDPHKGVIGEVTFFFARRRWITDKDNTMHLTRRQAIEYLQTY